MKTTPGFSFARGQVVATDVIVFQACHDLKGSAFSATRAVANEPAMPRSSLVEPATDSRQDQLGQPAVWSPYGRQQHGFTAIYCPRGAPDIPAHRVHTRPGVGYAVDIT